MDFSPLSSADLLSQLREAGQGVPDQLDDFKSLRGWYKPLEGVDLGREEKGAASQELAYE